MDRCLSLAARQAFCGAARSIYFLRPSLASECKALRGLRHAKSLNWLNSGDKTLSIVILSPSASLRTGSANNLRFRCNDLPITATILVCQKNIDSEILDGVNGS